MLAVANNFERYLEKMGFKILIVYKEDLKNYVLEEFKKTFIIDKDILESLTKDEDSELFKNMYYALSRYIDKMKDGMEKEKTFQSLIINLSYCFKKHKIEPFVEITLQCFISLKEITE